MKSDSKESQRYNPTSFDKTFKKPRISNKLLPHFPLPKMSENAIICYYKPVCADFAVKCFFFTNSIEKNKILR